MSYLIKLRGKITVAGDAGVEQASAECVLGSERRIEFDFGDFRDGLSVLLSGPGRVSDRGAIYRRPITRAPAAGDSMVNGVFQGALWNFRGIELVETLAVPAFYIL